MDSYRSEPAVSWDGRRVGTERGRERERRERERWDQTLNTVYNFTGQHTIIQCYYKWSEAIIYVWCAGGVLQVCGPHKTTQKLQKRTNTYGSSWFIIHIPLIIIWQHVKEHPLCFHEWSVSLIRVLFLDSSQGCQTMQQILQIYTWE